MNYYVSRFGENDNSLSMEDKVFARFQQERKKRVRSISKFNLPEDNDKEDLLTHQGKVHEYFY